MSEVNKVKMYCGDLEQKRNVIERLDICELVKFISDKPGIVIRIVKDWHQNKKDNSRLLH